MPNRAGTVVPSGGFGSTVNIQQTIVFENSGALDASSVIPLLEGSNQKLKAEILDDLDRGAFA